MRPGTVIAAACLALLSVLRFSEQSYVAAAVFAVLALGALALSLRPRPSAGTPEQLPSPDQVREAQTAHERYRRGWRQIAIVGFAISIVGVFVFPPMALVVAGLSLYAVRRMRQSSRSTQLLGRAAG